MNSARTSYTASLLDLLMIVSWPW